MLEDIMLVFEKNYNRIHNLLNFHTIIDENLLASYPTISPDILRAAVVFMHSTLEDLLSNLLAWKLPEAPPEVINQMSLVGNLENRKTNFKLGELIPYKNITVEELIKRSIEEYLQSKSFNNCKDVVNSLSLIGVSNSDEIQKTLPLLEDMIKRRHKIVHEADREKNPRSNTYETKAINIQLVTKWKENLDDLILEIVEQLKEDEE